MSRATIIITSQADRDRAAMWARKAPAGTSVTFKANKRTAGQNARMWAMLTDVAQQATHHGNRYTADQWKILFMHACGQEVQFLPGLDGKTFVPWGQRSSDLTKEEMTDLMEFISAWGAENGITFHDSEQVAA